MYHVRWSYEWGWWWWGRGRGCILNPRLIAFLMRPEKFIFCLPSAAYTHAAPELPGDYGEEKGHYFNHTQELNGSGRNGGLRVSTGPLL